MQCEFHSLLPSGQKKQREKAGNYHTPHWKFMGCWHPIKSPLMNTLKGASTLLGVHGRTFIGCQQPKNFSASKVTQQARNVETTSNDASFRCCFHVVCPMVRWQCWLQYFPVFQQWRIEIFCCFWSTQQKQHIQSQQHNGILLFFDFEQVLSTGYNLGHKYLRITWISTNFRNHKYCESTANDASIPWASTQTASASRLRSLGS